ncbi:hypothetical protein [Oceanobacillus oncorhynchi]|uniref:hypothetical protein n=1 Tax=Oceanobacillus oncorhynchi TaxID=545501 RepID=UPI002117289F|nr:hypothetical protein [Oceanobacillus oncorhynchi]UUI41167.1 hypothetical protein NP440_06265 [Oceanobacillus oncorhynchi]
MNEADIAGFLNKIKNVDRKSFTRDTFDIYLEILSVTEGQVEYFWKRSLEINGDGVGEILEEAIKELIALKNTLEQKHEEKEKEYSSL